MSQNRNMVSVAEQAFQKVGYDRSEARTLAEQCPTHALRGTVRDLTEIISANAAQSRPKFAGIHNT